MWDSLGKSASKIIDERLSSPLVSSFIIAWCLYNYRFFVILFSKNTVKETFALIAERFPDAGMIFVHGFFFPAIAAAVYLFLLPFPSRWVYEKWREQQKKTDEIRERFESQQRLTLDESRDLRVEMRSKDAEIDALTASIGKHKADLKVADERNAASAVAEREATSKKTIAEEELQKALTRLELMAAAAASDRNPKPVENEVTPPATGFKDYFADADNDVSEEHMEILRLVGSEPNKTWEDIGNLSAQLRVEADYYIQDLIDKNLIEQYRSEYDDMLLLITQAGRRAVVLADKLRRERSHGKLGQADEPN